MADNLTNLTPPEKLLLARQTLKAIAENPSAYNLSVDAIDELTLETEALDSDLKAHTAARAEARSRRAAKDARTKKVENLLRKTLRFVRATSENKQSAITALGLRAPKANESVDATVPHASVDTSQRFQHTISFFDEAAPDLKRKPRGTLGCEIHVKIGGDPPADEKDCSFLTITPKNVYTATFEAADVGKFAHYLLRWRMRDGSTGAWGAKVSATITG